MYEKDRSIVWASMLSSMSMMGCKLEKAQVSDLSNSLMGKKRYLETYLTEVNPDVLEDLNERMDKFLDVYIDMNSKYMIVLVIREMLSMNHPGCIEFNRELLRISRMTKRQLETCKNADKNERKLIQVIESNTMILTSKSYYAFNLSNAAALIKVFYFRGEFEKDLYFHYLRLIADIVAENYSSYSDFGSQIAAVNEYVKIEARINSVPNVRKLLSKVSLDKAFKDVWNHIDWKGN